MKKISKITVLFALLTVIGYSLQAKDCLEEYSAKYKFPSGSPVSEIEIVVNNGNLYLNSPMGKIAMEQSGTDQFIMPSCNGKVVFKRNVNNEITGVNIVALGVTLDGAIEKNATKKNVTDIKTSAPSKVLLPKWFETADDIVRY